MTDDARPPVCAPRNRRWMLAAAILASALGFIDGTVVAIALPAIRESLNASLAQAQWINNAYMLPLSALILAGGALGDRFGLVRVFGAGIAVFLLGSAATALAPTPEAMIAARALKGAGAAAMVPGSLALVARAYPRAERGRAIGLWAAASALTTAGGPVIGGLILSAGGEWTWRLVFALNLPLGAIALWLLHSKAEPDPGRPEAPVDWPGAVLATLGLFALAWGLTRPGQWPVSAAGIGIFALFLLWQARAPAPMMPLDLFRSRAFAAANGLTFALYFALSTMIFFVPMALIGGWGVSEAAASVAFAPLALCVGAFSGLAGRVADRIGPAPPILAGALTVAAGYAAFAATAPAAEFWTRSLPALALTGLGMSMLVAPLSTAVMISVPDARAGAASGVNNAVTRMAGLIAVAAMGGVAAARYHAAGGPASFGTESAAAGHMAASTAALATLAWIAAALAALAAPIAWLGLRAGGAAAQASSSASQ
ncbi:MFS transporter [Rhodosalinus halophilus]|uniref:MFS transporter n=1 Tax=Rhodosalinus halophilus TaxID=2259333 RepID=A0A365U547_9RHOB|nr:MFS transporter [Rhodosalinus halophilus]RBI83214.1 MFS transporter [Rhodosalinus halophilus]